MSSTEAFENSEAGIRQWCQAYIANILGGRQADSIDPDAEFDSFGLDSAMAVAMILELEENLDEEVSPSLLFDHPTIRSLSEHLSARGNSASALERGGAA